MATTVDNQTYLNYSLMVGAAITAWLLSQIFSFAMTIARLGPYLGTYRDIAPLFLGIACGVAAFSIARRHPAVNKFGTEVVVELRKVTWPTRKEVHGATGAVLVIVFICAVILYIFDKIFDFLIALLMGL